MKHFNSILILLVLFLTACSSSESGAPATPAAKEIEGSYTGTLAASVMNSESLYESMTLTVTATDDATVSVVTPSFGTPPMQMPSITIEGVKVAGEDGTYVLDTTKFSQESGGKKCSGTLEGAFADGKLTISFSLNYGAMPMPIICSFTAPKDK
ncbi:MAG: calycin-like domain-containing protein [Duncaniella sp.]|nr:calycin-like domain-containing protein [Duncaniella sp.]MDE6390536.1 calycin-like domain-containing protein [Duncaniella sp.]